MTGDDSRTVVGQFPRTAATRAFGPAVLTRLAWGLWVVSIGVLVARLWAGEAWSGSPASLSGVFRVDGLTVVMWVVASFFGGIVHSYSVRYLAGSRGVRRFFTRIFGFTLTVMLLVAADHLLVFLGAWLAMGLVMADLIGFSRSWPQAQAAASDARRSFLLGTALLAVAFGALWSLTGATTVSGVLAAVENGGLTAAGSGELAAAGGGPAAVESLASAAWLIAVLALVVAAAVQSALFPFHSWLLGSMTAPTPASALMHAGFVNAGGILLVRFASVLTVEPWVLPAVAVVGVVSAVGGKLAKSVQSDVKRQLGCSTVGQMGFMILQAGLGFFGAALTHLVLHGFYKAYMFLSAGGRVEQTAPTTDSTTTNGHESETTAGGHGARSGESSAGVVDWLVTAVAAVAGGGLFALLTGKGTTLDSGLLLTVLVVVTTLHATRTVVGQQSLSRTLGYAAVPVVFLPSVAVYAAVYRGVTALLRDLPVVTAPAELTVVHAALVGVFLLAYVAIESEVYRHSERLYVALLNATQPPSPTILTDTEEYNEY